jgi:hypothetical protein
MYEPLFRGPAADWLAGIGIVSCLYWGYRLLAALIRYAQNSPLDTGAPPTELAAAHAAAVAAAAHGHPEDLPVIAAAVAAVLDNHRIVHIEELPHGRVWSAQGRWLNQMSHRPH